MTKLEILKTPDCSYCNKCLKLVDDAKKDFSGLKVEVVNVLEHPELMEKYRIMSVPAIVIDGKLEFVGVPRKDELKDRLKQIIKTGDE